MHLIRFFFFLLPILAEKLQELLDKADDPQALPEERKEMEELKILLPEIQGKVDDATEGQKSAGVAADAVKDALVSRLSMFVGTTITIVDRMAQ